MLVTNGEGEEQKIQFLTTHLIHKLGKNFILVLECEEDFVQLYDVLILMMIDHGVPLGKLLEAADKVFSAAIHDNKYVLWTLEMTQWMKTADPKSIITNSKLVLAICKLEEREQEQEQE